ncbi:hypothetical protein F5Y06DRAFT_146100 [Hypoxylon sp. FL0890]|nr:hypothetical protein F5Y06DRAFT_146100 [Hypoxylon sp. FL0890]
MASLRSVLTISVLIAAALAAQNLTTYMPECVRPCLEQSINNTSCTGPEDSQCLCSNQQRVGYSTFTCAEQGGACPGNSAEQLRSSMMSAYQQYCSDTNATSSGNSVNGFPAFATSGWVTGASATATSSTTHPPTSTPTTVNDEPSSSGSGGSSSSISAGAIAGIAVGGGVAVISITGGLLLLAFRLGKGYSSRKKGADPADPGQQGAGEGGHGGDGQLVGVTDDTAAKNETQLDGKPVSELQTEYTLSGFDPVKELPTQEKPAELPADAVPRYVEERIRMLSDNSWRFRDHPT